MSTEIDVDRDLCIGSATCLRLAPGAFALDDDEIAIVEDPHAVGVEKLRLAADACPARAITVSEHGGSERG
jgi:ferredoxin